MVLEIYQGGGGIIHPEPIRDKLLRGPENFKTIMFTDDLIFSCEEETYEAMQNLTGGNGKIAIVTQRKESSMDMDSLKKVADIGYASSLEEAKQMITAYSDFIMDGGQKPF